MHKRCVEKQTKTKSSLKGHTAKVREIPWVRPAGCTARAPRQCPRLTLAAACPAQGSPPARLSAEPVSALPSISPGDPGSPGRTATLELTACHLPPERAVAPRFRLALGRGWYLSASSGPEWPVLRGMFPKVQSCFLSFQTEARRGGGAGGGGGGKEGEGGLTYNLF